MITLEDFKELCSNIESNSKHYETLMGLGIDIINSDSTKMFDSMVDLLLRQIFDKKAYEEAKDLFEWRMYEGNSSHDYKIYSASDETIADLGTIEGMYEYLKKEGYFKK